MSDAFEEVAAQIVADPAHVESYLVLADLLMNQGDPRGELIVLQHRLTSGATDKKLRARAGKLLDRQKALLETKTGVTSNWFLGYASSATMPMPARGRQIADSLRALFAHPSARFLTDLELHETFEVTTSSPKANLANALAAVLEQPRPCLRTLTLRQSVHAERQSRLWEIDGFIRRLGECAHAPAPAFESLPRLARLVLDNVSRLHTLEHAHLPSLVIVGTPVCDAGEWLLPELRSLEWRPNDRGPTGTNFRPGQIPLEALDRIWQQELPALRDLTLRGIFPTGYTHRPAVAAVIKRLDRLCVPVSALPSSLVTTPLEHLSKLLVTSVEDKVPDSILRRFPNATWCTLASSDPTVNLDAKLPAASVQRPLRKR